MFIITCEQNNRKGFWKKGSGFDSSYKPTKFARVTTAEKYLMRLTESFKKYNLEIKIEEV